MQGGTSRELWEVALRLEVWPVEMAAPLIDTVVIARLEANAAAMEKTLSEGRSIIAIDVEFHALINPWTSRQNHRQCDRLRCSDGQLPPLTCPRSYRS